jgi:hypothetical protein
MLILTWACGLLTDQQNFPQAYYLAILLLFFGTLKRAFKEKVCMTILTSRG